MSDGNGTKPNCHSPRNIRRTFQVQILQISLTSTVVADSVGVGFRFDEKGLYPEARNLFQGAITIQRSQAPPLNNLGVLYLKLGQPGDAIAVFRLGIRQAPDDDMLYISTWAVSTFRPATATRRVE
jgi:tetratricopeptide (TPR) repeat protein